MRNICLAACLIIAAAAPVSAEEVSQRIAAVSLTGGQVANGKPSAQLQVRIDHAVSEVCGTTADTLDQYTDLVRCRKAARAAVAEQIARHSRSHMLAARK